MKYIELPEAFYRPGTALQVVDADASTVEIVEASGIETLAYRVLILTPTGAYSSIAYPADRLEDLKNWVRSVWTPKAYSGHSMDIPARSPQPKPNETLKGIRGGRK